jgi:phosphotransferase system  glucose/maltose/N-acetylglucosamine-specific IIC component
MYSYTASVFWLLSWPVLIIIAFFLSRWALKKFNLMYDEEVVNEDKKEEQPDTAGQ